MNDEKTLMYEAATLYYDKKLTQQEIAVKMQLSRQTVSRLLNDALRENVVEIKIHNPQRERQFLEGQICDAFGIDTCVVCSAGSDNGEIRRTMTVRAAIDYLLPIIKKGNLKIGVSWGRTVRELIQTLPETATVGNTVFPLFGATENEKDYFSSNELARNLADKLGANLKQAWFPYKPESEADYHLLKQLSYYQKMQAMWDSADLAILGIGNTEILEIFGRTFGYSQIHRQAIGDVATNFFDANGAFVNLYENTLCASAENIRNIKRSVAIASGTEKAAAIAAALRTGAIDILITDEQTAREILKTEK